MNTTIKYRKTEFRYITEQQALQLGGSYYKDEYVNDELKISWYYNRFGEPIRLDYYLDNGENMEDIRQQYGDKGLTIYYNKQSHLGGLYREYDFNIYVYGVLKATGKRVDDTQQRPIYYKSIDAVDNSIISFSKSHYNDNFHEDEFGAYAQPIFKFIYKDNGDLDELFKSTIPIYVNEYPSKLRTSEILEDNGAGLEDELDWAVNTYYHEGNTVIPQSPIV